MEGGRAKKEDEKIKSCEDEKIDGGSRNAEVGKGAKVEKSNAEVENYFPLPGVHDKSGKRITRP